MREAPAPGEAPQHRLEARGMEPIPEAAQVQGWLELG